MEIKYPKGETVWVSYQKSDGTPIFILTSKPARDFYFLYEVLDDGSVKKLGKARSPTELEEKFDVMMNIFGIPEIVIQDTWLNHYPKS